MKARTNRTLALALYFGLIVEVLKRMENYSLISFQGRKVIVDTTDLIFSRRPQQAFLATGQA